MAQQSGRGQPAWREGPVRPRRESQYGWKASRGPRTAAGRRLAWFGLLTGSLVCLGLVGYLLFLLSRPPQPCFVAIAADPTADAESLDVPLDFSGWQSARRFLDRAREWAGRTASGWNSARVVAGPNGGPSQLPSGEAELAQWLDQDQFRKCDPVIIYFGLHCGTEAGPAGPEPVLFVGGRNRLPVRRLLAGLANSPLRNKRLVLLLDPGRLPFSPVYGHLTDVFPAALRSLDDEIRKCPNLVILSGCDTGQRGWESEELRSTAFADAIIRAMDDPTGSTDAFTAAQLFETAKTLTEQWARDNRPFPQTPVLLPSGLDGQDEEGHRRAAGARVGVRSAGASPAVIPAALDLPKDWRVHWERHARFEAQAPHPAAYTPRLWRRYCELLLRYETAARAGEGRTLDRLGAALRSAEDDLGRSIFPVEPAELPQLQAFRSLRDTNAGGVGAKLWAVASGREDLPAEAVRGESGLRAAEWHTAVMVRQYYRAVRSPQGPPPDGWREALDIRALADRTALGLPMPGEPLTSSGPGPAAPFSERTWPFIRSAHKAMEARRRDIEDRLFSPDIADHPSAAVAESLRTDYATAASVAAEARFAFQVRDRVLADLPFLSWWAVNRAEATEADLRAVLDLWDRAHKLETGLADSAPPVSQARDVWEGFQALHNRFNKALGDQLQVAALQQEWAPKEALLAIPLVPPAQREQVLRASHTITTTLLTAAASKAGIEPRAPANIPDAKALTSYRVRLAQAELGPGGSAEPLSRLSIAFERDDHPENEPAAVNARLRWRNLLTDLAERAFDDHWYDENPARGGKPYYHRAATQFLIDADRFGGGAPTALAGVVRSKLEQVKPLSVQFLTDAGAIRWTSEARRNLRFELAALTGVPPGRAVVVRKTIFPQDGPQPVRYEPNQGAPSRDLIELKPTPQPLDLELRSTTDKDIQAKGKLIAGLYYRGQMPADSRDLDVYRRPELVVSDPGPKSDSASVCIRAEGDRPPAAITILIDYSGSMKEGLNGFRLPGTDDAWKEGPSKFNLAIQRLEAVLAELPKGTPLRIRLFSARDLPDEEAVVYPGPDESAVADWRGTDGKRLKDLISRLRRYEPYGGTPLIQSIILSARADFQADTDGPKVLVVLTDGADDSGKEGAVPEERELLRKEMKNALTATGVKLFVVQLALNEADRKVSSELFADLPNLDTPGEVVSVSDAEGLRRELTNAIWPKLILTGGGGQRPGTSKYPPAGWPSRPSAVPRGNTDLEGTVEPNALFWSPELSPGTYNARLSPFRLGQLPKIQLEPGDFLPLSVARDGKGFTLRRELHADAFGRAIKKFGGDGDWVLSVPSSGVEDGIEPCQYGAVAMVERVPPHRRKGPAEPEQLIRHILPGAMWWSVAPEGATLAAGEPPVGWGETQTVVTRLYGYPAPAWGLRVEGWPRSDRLTPFPPATVRVWARAEASGTTTFRVAKDQIPTDGGELEYQANGRMYRLTFEEQKLADSPARVVCLVVRTFYADASPVQLLLTRSVPGIQTEHRYFRKANAYTAVFGPGAVSESGVEFRVVPIALLTASPGAEIAVTPPAPTAGRRPDGYRPAPSGEAK